LPAGRAVKASALELFQRVLPYELKADVDLDFRTEGLRVALSMPLI
jgi:hypothetical protein